MEDVARRVHATAVLSQSDAEYSLGLAVSDVEKLHRAERFAEEAASAFAALLDRFNEAKARYNRAAAVLARAKIALDADVLSMAGDLYAAAADALRYEGDQSLFGRALLGQASALAEAAMLRGHVENGQHQAAEALLCEAAGAFAAAGDIAGGAEVQVARAVNSLRSHLGVPLFGVVVLDDLAGKAAADGALLDQVVAAATAIQEATRVLLEHGLAPAAGQGLLAQGLAVFITALATDNPSAVQQGMQLFELAAAKFHEAGHRRDEALALSMQSSALLNLAPRVGDPALFGHAVTRARAALALVHESDRATIAGLRLLEARGIGEHAMVCGDTGEWRAALAALEAAITGFAGADIALEASLLHSKGGILAKIAEAESDREMFLDAAQAFAGAGAASTDVRLSTSSFVYKGVALASAAFLAGERDEMKKAVAALEAAVEHCRDAGDLEHLALGQMSLSGAVAELAIQDRDAAAFARASALLEATAARFEALGHQEGASEARALASGLPTEWRERVEGPTPSSDGGKA